MTKVVLVLLVALVISTGCGGASAPTGLSAPSTTQADAPLSDVERAWCIDNVWELLFALDPSAWEKTASTRSGWATTSRLG